MRDRCTKCDRICDNYGTYSVTIDGDRVCRSCSGDTHTYVDAMADNKKLKARIKELEEFIEQYVTTE